MTQKLYMEEGEVPEMCLSLYKNYGTTMAGLKVRSDISLKGLKHQLP